MKNKTSKRDEAFYMYVFIPYALVFLSTGILLARQFTSSTLLFDQINFLSLASLFFYLVYTKIIKTLSMKTLLFCAAFTVSISLITSSVLLNIDRSRSLFVLGWVHHDLITLKDNTFDFTKIHSQEKLNYAAVAQRITENETRKLISIESDRLSLTFLGNLYYRIAESLSKFFRLTGWQQNSY